MIMSNIIHILQNIKPRDSNDDKKNPDNHQNGRHFRSEIDEAICVLSNLDATCKYKRCCCKMEADWHYT